MLRADGKIGAHYVSPARRATFLEVIAADGEQVAQTLTTLPFARFFDVDVYPTAPLDASVFLLSGSGVFWAGHDRWELKSGDTVFLPRRVPHTYLFTSDDVELLTICNPSGMEEFFRAAGWDLANPKPEDWAVDMKSLAKIGADAGQIVLGPPLSRDDRMPARYLDRP